MDIIRPYKSNLAMNDIERTAHLQNLNRQRRNRCYRKKKIEQFKLKQHQEPQFTIKKIGSEDKEDVEDVEDVELLLDLYYAITIDPNDKDVLETIEILEDELEIDEDEKLNANGDFDTDKEDEEEEVDNKNEEEDKEEEVDNKNEEEDR
jgi:hypothetical protein